TTRGGGTGSGSALGSATAGSAGAGGWTATVSATSGSTVGSGGMNTQPAAATAAAARTHRTPRRLTVITLMLRHSLVATLPVPRCQRSQAGSGVRPGFRGKSREGCQAGIPGLKGSDRGAVT